MPTNFERVKMILDKLCPALPQPDAAKLMQTRLNSLSASYPRITNPNLEPIDYSDPATQAAYLYKYVVANAALVARTLWSSAKVGKQIFQRPKVRIACIGGGPGTELIGVFKYLDHVFPRVKEIDCIILDHHPTWQAVWPVVASTAPTGVSVSVQYERLDMRAASGWFDSPGFLEADVFTFSYSLSEAWRYNENGGLSALIDTIVSSAAAGSLFIYCDNSGGAFDPNFQREFGDRPDLAVLSESRLDHMLIDGEEESSVLAGYREWVGGNATKMTGEATIVAMVKVTP